MAICLRNAPVQEGPREALRAPPQGRPDVLPGYIVLPLKITDPDIIATSGTAHHTSVHETGDPHDKVPGTLFRITQAELAAADAYEVPDVKRVTVRLGSGVDAFVYVNAQQSTASRGKR